MHRGWREKVERDLGGASFERTLVTELAGGLRIQPLYDGGSGRRLGRAGDVELAVIQTSPGDAGEALAGVEARWWLGTPPAPVAGVVEERSSSAVTVREAGRTVAHALDVVDAGGSVPLEVAVAVARFLDAIRAEGRAPALATALGTEVFVEVAKLRALRLLAGRAAHALLGQPAEIRVLARTSLVSFSRIEPETNALRATLGAVAGLVGGADLVATAPYDVLSEPAHDHARAERLASTTALIAVLESQLAATRDPAHGSYLVESLTDDIATAAWRVVRELEAAGGAAQAGERWRARLADEREERRRAAVKGKLPRVGASRLAAADAPVAGSIRPSLAQVERDTAAFEALRDERLAGPIAVIVAGDGRKLAPRADYVREVASTWGSAVELLRFATLADAAGAVAGGAVAPGRPVAVCVEDAAFPELAPLVRALAPRPVVVAGRPGPHEPTLRDAGARTFVFVGADLPAVARELFDGGSR
jgi:methylmalonyl-CoA mutase